MRRSIFSFSLGLATIALTWGQTGNAFPLRPMAPERLDNVGFDSKLSDRPHDLERCVVERWQTTNCPERATSGWNEAQRQDLLQAIDHSLYYLSTPKAAQSYRKLANSQFNLDRVRRSLLRFKELLLTTDSPTALERAVKQEFRFYQSVGNDLRGKVEFTGYFEPTYTASRVRTPKYRYPLYRKPANFNRWSSSHPTRAQLEGKDGLAGNKSILKDRELVWLSDRLEAYLVQVQGSARLKMTDGTTMSVGYDGTTNYPYVSIGAELVKDGVFDKDELSLPKLLDYFAANPKQLNQYLPRNNRFIFFRKTDGKPPTGNLGVPVTGDRSIATDKSLMPPGALALIVAPVPDIEPTGEIDTRVVSRYVLDQDTGSAIKGAGRVDVFLGSGEIAGERAGRLNGNGHLFYLLLKE
ncbi:MltA domain-containing protein [Pleurocapsales cyanobacterium LEGE 10410]|nr:MltA domain-containing protein [Pleurocapsales cyanobacterium LEGE 10410]